MNVPIPTIFKNNIDQFLNKNSVEKYNSNNMLVRNDDQTLSHSIDSIDGVGELANVDTIQILDDECMYLGKGQEYDIDGMEAYCLTTNAEGPIQIYRNNDVEFMMEERLEEDEQQDDIYDEFQEDVKNGICYTLTKDYENMCRLCAETVASGSDMVNLFTSSLSHALEQINKLLPKQVRILNIITTFLAKQRTGFRPVRTYHQVSYSHIFSFYNFFGFAFDISFISSDILTKKSQFC